MDFKGQQYSEQLALKLLTLTAVASFLLGYFRQDFGLMMSLFAVGFAITFVVTVPNWPMYNTHPIEWVKSKTASGKKKPTTGFLSSVRTLFE